MTWAVICRMIDRLEERLPGLDDINDLIITLADAPSHVWVIRTKTFFHYVLRNVDKFATGFEIMAARTRDGVYTWEETKIIAIFLRGLRFSVAGQALCRESALWWGRRDRVREDGDDRPRTWYSLGFGTTLPRYGYC